MFRSPRLEHVAALIAAALVYCSMASVPRAGGMENDGLPGAVAERRVDYAGEYTRTDGTPIYVASRDDRWVVVVAGNVLPLRQNGPDRFEVVGVSESVRFERGHDGAVVAVLDSQGRYPLNSRVLPARVAAMFSDSRSPRYRYAPPASIDGGLPVDDASRHGLSRAAIEKIVGDIETEPDYRHVHSLLVQRKGVLILEKYFAGFDRDLPHNLRSATKSVIATLVGAAILRGDITIDDHPLAAIADSAGVEITDHKRTLTLADLLDMRHGLRCDDWDADSPGNERNIYAEDDWTSFILSIPDAEAADDPSYCSAMPLMVGRYLEIATRKSLTDFADESVFTPLGMRRDQWRWDFDLRAKRTPHGGQIHLRPYDMMWIGTLYARDGVAMTEVRLLPSGWVEETFDAIMPLGDWRRYHNFWWSYDVIRPPAASVTIHTASGIGGQRIAVIPMLDLIIVMTGGSFDEGQRGPRMVIERLVRAISN